MYQSEIAAEKHSMVHPAPPHILIIDDELSICTGIQGILETDDCNASYALTYQDGLEYLDQHPDLDIIILDVNLRSDLSGIEVLPLIHERNKYVQVIMFTSYDRLDIGLECMKNGALDFMTKPFDEKKFLDLVPRAIEKKRLEQIKDLYFDMVVHDLKNPLQCICGSFELLQDQFTASLTPLQRKLFETAASGIQQIQLIIGNILGVTSFEKGSLTARRESFDLDAALTEATQLYDNLEVHQSSTLPVSIRSDRDLYIRVLNNLLSNATRFALVGSPVRVYCEYEPEERTLLTTVKNHGSYISEKHRDIIFNKFVGVQRTIGSLRGQNFGLGLTFSKMAVEALEGAIWVESDQQRQETEFKFRIKDHSVL